MERQQRGQPSNSLSLSVTDTNSHTETFTYDFLVPSGGTYSGGGSVATWPTSLPPNLELAQAPTIASQNVARRLHQRCGERQHQFAQLQPQRAGISLSYDSLTANPLPIVVVPHTIDPTQAAPTKDSGQITVSTTGGTTVYTGSTYYYNTGQYMPGDIQQLALQASMTGQSTGRYNYTATVVDYRSTATTTRSRARKP